HRASMNHVGHGRNEARRKLHHRPQHPGAEDDGCQQHRHDFRNEHQRLLLNLRCRLKQADQQPHHEPGQKHGARHQQHRQHRVPPDIAAGPLSHSAASLPTSPRSAAAKAVRHWKLSSSDRVTNCHPSTKTNSSTLKGREIMTGGKSNIPMAINVLATIISMTRNGINNMKPSWNAVFNSLMTNAGMSRWVGTCSLAWGKSISATSTKRRKSCSRV